MRNSAGVRLLPIVIPEQYFFADPTYILSGGSKLRTEAIRDAITRPSKQGAAQAT
jgi:hypothetical protein